MKSKWNLVIHDCCQSTVNIWVGTLFPDLRKPELCSVVLLDNNLQQVACADITRQDWLRPFSRVNDRFYQLINFPHLNANTTYQVQFIRRAQQIGSITLSEKILASGSFKTLPAQLSQTQPFVVAMGSCFYNEGDNGDASGAYTELYFNGDAINKPDVKFLTGDQVYLDIGLDSLSPVPCEVRKRIADDYAATWQTQRQMLRHGATWFLADDHEYWNNYPYTSGKNPYLWMLTAFNNIRSAWTQTASSAVKNVQQIRLFRSFNLANDLSVCFVDLRSQRDKGNNPKKMLPNKTFKQLITWAKSLTSPGVIVLPQPLLVHKGGELDWNLANYSEQYQTLLQALSFSGHDIVCLTGDVHFGRIAKVEFGEQGAILHEIIASPMSNLTGLDGKVAASSPEKLLKFPTSAISGVPVRKVQYEKSWAVGTQKVKFLRFFSYKKTKEHFMTLAFNKTADNNIKILVQAWRIRERYKNTSLPKAEFKQHHEIILKKQAQQ